MPPKHSAAATKSDAPSKEKLARERRTGRIYSVIGKLLFLFGILLAVVGGWFVFGPGMPGVDDTTGTVLFVLAVVILFDGVFFAYLGRRILAKARAQSNESQDHSSDADHPSPPTSSVGR